jgi:hypothetical protein
MFAAISRFERPNKWIAIRETTATSCSPPRGVLSFLVGTEPDVLRDGLNSVATSYSWVVPGLDFRFDIVEPADL